MRQLIIKLEREIADLKRKLEERDKFAEEQMSAEQRHIKQKAELKHKLELLREVAKAAINQCQTNTGSRWTEIAIKAAKEGGALD